MESWRWKAEGVLRTLSVLLLVLTACLIAFDSQTEVIFFSYAKTATFRDLNALYVLVWIHSAVAVYNLIQLLRDYVFFPGFRQGITASYRCVAWGVYLLDQVTVYVAFAANTAALQASMLAVTGEQSFQWMKLCNRYKRFCVQIGGALLCGYAAVIVMAITCSLSAYALFRLYSPKQFLLLKGTSFPNPTSPAAAAAAAMPISSSSL